MMVPSYHPSLYICLSNSEIVSDTPLITSIIDTQAHRHTNTDRQLSKLRCHNKQSSGVNKESENCLVGGRWGRGDKRGRWGRG